MIRPRRPMRSHAIVLALAAATAVSACSSTNDKKFDAAGGDASASPTSTAAPLLGANGKPLTKEQIAAAVKAGKLPPSALASLSAAPSTTGGGTSGGTSGGTTGGSTGVVPVARVGPGVTAKTIKIGFTLFKVGDFAKQFGIDADPGDNQAQVKAVVAYVNAHGGVAGRKVVPSFYTVDFTRTNGQDGQFEAEACAKWTTDDKVFGVVNLALNRPQFAPCIAKKDVIGVQNGIQSDAARLAKYHRWYYTTMSGSGVIMDRAARTETKMLCAKGWFKGATVGFIYFDDPGFRSIIDHTYAPAMTRCGMKRLVLQAAGRGGTNPDAAFVARFQQEHVTNVMFLAEGGGYPNFFMPAAESQLYRPKYSLRSDHAPALTLQGIVPDAQLANATGFGWSPVQDVDAAHDPGPTNRADKLCLDIMRNASIDVSNRGGRLAAVGYCSGLLFFQQALAHATSVTSAAFEKAVEALGTSFISPATFANRFNASQHDGPSVYREFSYADKAFRYTTGNKPMSG